VLTTPTSPLPRRLRSSIPAPPAGGNPSHGVISPSAKLGRNPSVGPYVVIEDGVELGDDCVLKSFAVVYRNGQNWHRFSLTRTPWCARRGDWQRRHPPERRGRGRDGFGFAKLSDGAYYKIVQAGSLVVEDNV